MGDGYAAAGRGVGKRAVGEVDADMARPSGRAKEDQIASLEFVAVYAAPFAHLVFRRAREVDSEQIDKERLDEPRAVDATLAVAADHVRRTSPLFHFRSEAVLHIALTCGAGV